MALRFDQEAWEAAGCPGTSFNPFPEPRSAKPDQLFGQELTGDAVGLSIGAAPRTVRKWAERSESWIESWREDPGAPETRRRRAMAFLRAFASVQVSGLFSRGPTATEGLDPAPERPTSWKWVPLAPGASAALTSLVLLRNSEGATILDPQDDAVAFAITRSAKGRGRGGWGFQRARIGTRPGLTSLPEGLGEFFR